MHMRMRIACICTHQVSRCLHCEVDYQRTKASLLVGLLHAYEACVAPTVAVELAQQMTDLMGARPRLDLTAQSFEAAYQAATLALRLEHVLLTRTLAAHVSQAVGPSVPNVPRDSHLGGHSHSHLGGGGSVNEPAASPPEEKSSQAKPSQAKPRPAKPSQATSPLDEPAALRRAAAAGCATVAVALHQEVWAYACTAYACTAYACMRCIRRWGICMYCICMHCIYMRCICIRKWA